MKTILHASKFAVILCCSALTTFAATPLRDVQMSGSNNQVNTGSTLTIKSGANFVIEGGAIISGTQPADATLNAWAAINTASNKISFWSGVDSVDTIDFSPFSQTLLPLTSRSTWMNAIMPSSPTTNNSVYWDGDSWELLTFDSSFSVTTGTLSVAKAPIDSAYWVATADSTLTGEIALGALGTGLLKNTTGTGVPSIAAAGSDYVAPGAVTSSGLTMATSKILGRSTAATGPVEELSLTQLLDLVGSSAQGDILYRGASGWTRLPAGTNGYYLKTLGTGADPAWAAVSSSGDVVGPASATDNALARFDSTTGKLIQNSNVTLADSGTAFVFSSAGGITAGGSNQNITLTPSGTGYTLINGLAGFGTTTPVSRITVVDESTVGTRGITAQQNTTDAAAALISFRKSRGSAASPSVVSTGDYIGDFTAQAHDGILYRILGNFGYKVTGSVGTDNVPGEWFFAASSSDDTDSYSNGTVRMKIASNGTVTFPSGTLVIGSDTNLYRSAADTLKTDDSFKVGGNLVVDWGEATSALPTAITAASTILRAATATGTGTGSTIIEGVGFGGNGLTLVARRAGGNRTTPAATEADVNILALNAYGYDTTWNVGQKGQYAIRSDGLWSGTNTGTYHIWQGTLNGSTTIAEWMRLQGGALRLSTYGAGTLTTDASGNVTASSDETLKVILGNFNRGLSALRDVQPITFKWKPSTGMDQSDTYSGFSAQNVMRAVPEAVGMNSNGTLALQDRTLLAVAVNAINELRAQNVLLAQMIKDLANTPADKARAQAVIDVLAAVDTADKDARSASRKASLEAIVASNKALAAAKAQSN